MRTHRRGHAVRPVLDALPVWGAASSPKRSGDEAFDAERMALPISGLVRPDRATGVTLRALLVVDGDNIVMRIDYGSSAFRPWTARPT
jgi:hypothetical protein